MFEAQAVFKTNVADKFDPAGFTVMVDVEPTSTMVMPDSMSALFAHMRDGRCDGFIIDLGDTKRYVIRP